MNLTMKCCCELNPKCLNLNDSLEDLRKMYPGGYTAEVTSLSPKATEQDVYNFFSHCGVVEHVDIRYGEYACTAYVTFRDAFALQTAILLSGARIVDQCVCISRWGSYVDEADSWYGPTHNPEGNSSPTAFHTNQFISSPGEAVTIVKTMAAKGYVLGIDALAKAKAFDESHQVSATAAAKVSELSNRIGLTERIHAGMEVVKTVDEKLHVSDVTKTAATYTGTAAVVAVTAAGNAAAAAGNAVVNSSYFAKGALWFSDMLTRASKAAAELGTHGST